MQDIARHSEAPRACTQCPIRHRAVCSLCGPEELTALDRIKTYRHYAPGETVFWAGDEMTFVASVVEGHATIAKTLGDGRRQTLGLLLPSDFIGRPDRATAPFDVVANSRLTLCCFRRRAFGEIVASTPKIGRRLLEMSLDELNAAREWMLLLGRKTAREKVASLLTIFARRDAALRGEVPDRGWTMRLPMTREQMADYLGMTLETVSRQMSALKRVGIIALPEARSLVIEHFDALVAESGDDADGGLPV